MQNSIYNFCVRKGKPHTYTHPHMYRLFAYICRGKLWEDKPKTNKRNKGRKYTVENKGCGKTSLNMSSYKS